MTGPLPKTATCVPSLRGMGGSFCGRKGMPADWIELMYADYLRLGSLAKAGQLHGRTRQSMFEIFKRRGLKLNPKTFLAVVNYKGLKFTSQKVCGRHRYLRCTSSRRKTKYLHHVIWIEHNGPIPRGHKVVFKDGNHLNWQIDNLELLTNSAQVSRHATGHNQFTRVAREKLGLLVGNFQSGRRTFAAELKEAT
jgi:hypothetical protein